MATIFSGMRPGRRGRLGVGLPPNLKRRMVRKKETDEMSRAVMGRKDREAVGAALRRVREFYP